MIFAGKVCFTAYLQKLSVYARRTEYQNIAFPAHTAGRKGKGKYIMATIIRAKHHESGQTYAWRCPKWLNAKPDNWALVKTRFGEKVVHITEVSEMDDEQAASLRRVLAVSQNRDQLHPRPNYAKEFWLRKQEAALWKEHGLDISPYSRTKP